MDVAANLLRLVAIDNLGADVELSYVTDVRVPLVLGVPIAAICSAYSKFKDGVEEVLLGTAGRKRAEARGLDQLQLLATDWPPKRSASPVPSRAVSIAPAGHRSLPLRSIRSSDGRSPKR